MNGINGTNVIEALIHGVDAKNGSGVTASELIVAKRLLIQTYDEQKLGYKVARELGCLGIPIQRVIHKKARALGIEFENAYLTLPEFHEEMLKLVSKDGMYYVDYPFHPFAQSHNSGR